MNGKITTSEGRRSIYPGPVGLKQQIGALLHRRRTQKQIVREVNKRMGSSIPLRVVVGAGSDAGLIGLPGSHYEDWLQTDHATLNALKLSEWQRLFSKASISNILAEHVVEHFTTEQFQTFLDITSRFLCPGGNLRIAVPDGFHPDEKYLEEVKPGGTGPGSEDHKALYNYKSLTAILDKENWHYDLLEYFDEDHHFHAKSWAASGGFIQRAQHTDPRNKVNELAYTSLIVDLHKKTNSCLNSRCFEQQSQGQEAET